MKKTVKIVTYEYKRTFSQIEYFCTCGYHVTTKVKGDFKCPTCNNEDIISLDRKYKTKVFDSEIYVIDKGLKHFHVAKDKYRIVFHKDNTISIKMIGKQELKYNLRYKESFIINTSDKKVEQYYANDRRIDAYFKGKNYTDLISTEDNRNLFEFAYRKLSRNGWYNACGMGKGLVNLLKYPFLELVYFGGFNRLEQLKDVIDYQRWYNTSATNLQDFFEVPKSILGTMKKMDDISHHAIEGLTNLYNEVGGHNFKIVMDILEQETGLSKLNINNFSCYFLELYKNYDYKNVKKLTLYVSREVKLQQGVCNPVDGLRYLNDYIRMMNNLEYKLEKYPKSLRKVHDIASMNFKIKTDEKMKQRFEERVISDDYKRLAFKSKEYSIMIPNNSNDLIKEGESLNHCVASYVKDVADGLCKILFLRETNNLNTPVLTIEVRGNRIIQIEGRSHRVPTNPEKEFVERWAEKNNLFLQFY
ncbi:PcfJ domain-containing protein [Brevibacillus laterosporus]|uniref:PcfJ domain-containing protein n=1 Tax=Brevibacillus laterosporus TaxID=1465 RepID=UPI00215D23C5|nr:PcfJ domain-containing protein [Brevibacillus laterosporus]MCR8994573.1 PcfJ domain-containing protein [Brevibacillus laterosporus]